MTGIAKMVLLPTKNLPPLFKHKYLSFWGGVFLPVLTLLYTQLATSKQYCCTPYSVALDQLIHRF